MSSLPASLAFPVSSLNELERFSFLLLCYFYEHTMFSLHYFKLYYNLKTSQKLKSVSLTVKEKYKQSPTKFWFICPQFARF